MKAIRSQAFLDLFADKKVKGLLPGKIRAVVDEPENLGSERTVLFDRYKRADAKQVGSYGTCVIVTEDERIYAEAEKDVTVVLVPDVEEAFWKFVSFYRQRFQLPVIAVTGTCGKTTTKEMIKHILAKRLHVQATKRSKNSGRFHLPYLLGIDEETEAAVFEMGVAKPGDVLESSRYFRPTVGVVTNIGVDHLNEFASYGEYVKAKEEMLAGLEYEGTLVLNRDDPNIATFDLAKYRGRILTFGLGGGADFKAKEIRAGRGGMEFTLVYQHMAHTLFVPGYGTHNLYNALAAIAAVYAVGVGIEEAGDALRTYEHLQGHMNVLSGIKGSIVIDDTWNSNPTSVETAIQVLCDLADGRKKIVVLGRMAALGEYAAAEYKRVTKKLVDAGIDVLITKGSIARDFAKHALKLGMGEQNVYACYEMAEILEVLDKRVDDHSIVLVKTSMNDAHSVDLIKKITTKAST